MCGVSYFVMCHPRLGLKRHSPLTGRLAARKAHLAIQDAPFCLRLKIIINFPGHQLQNHSGICEGCTLIAGAPTSRRHRRSLITVNPGFPEDEVWSLDSSIEARWAPPCVASIQAALTRQSPSQDSSHLQHKRLMRRQHLPTRHGSHDHIVVRPL